MMWRAKDKLRDNNGVTILMALFALLVAAMVSVVILGAAVTTVKQAKTEQEQEQNTLILQSTGDLIVSNICDESKTYCTYKKTVTTTFSYDEGGAQTGSTQLDPVYTDPKVSDGCIVKGELQSAMTTLLSGSWNGTPTVGTASFTINTSVPNSEGGDSELSKKIRVDITCNDSKTTENTNFANKAVFTLTLLSDDGNKEVQTLNLKVNAKETPGAIDTVDTYSGEGANRRLDSSSTTTTFTYTWNTPVYYLASEVGQ